MPLVKPFKGIFPAMQLPYDADYKIDEPELRQFTARLANCPGIRGLVTNGHTGEVFALSPDERAEATRIVADECSGKVPVISGICCEGIDEACDHAEAAQRAGAKGLLLMPPHYWLRFGMQPEHVIAHFEAVSRAVDINLIVHIYPAWTRASYSEELLAELARLNQVTTFKIGTREMSKYDRDIRAIRSADPSCTILTCHDEYLLSSMVQGVDGALVGFASFIPEWIVALYDAVQEGDLQAAQAIQNKIFPLKEVVYGSGEPSSEAHSRMKTAMMLAGILHSNRVRPPVTRPRDETLSRIHAALDAADLLAK